MSTEFVEFDLGDLARDLEALGNAGPAILARGLNRANTAGKTAMVRAVAADTGLQSKYVAREILVDRASRSKPVSALTIKGDRIPLIAFQARGPEPTRGRGRGVSYKLKGGRNRAPHAFIATMRGSTGHRGVFERKPGSSSKSEGAWSLNLPIRELRGPSLPHVFEAQVQVYQRVAEEALLRNLEHDIDFAVRPTTGESPGTEGA